jgi:hypothetical protein
VARLEAPSRLITSESSQSSIGRRGLALERNERHQLILLYRADSSMKFRIEVVRAGEGGRVEVLHRFTADEISPKRIKVRADQLLKFWRNRGATSARVLNPRGEELYVSL